MKILVWRIKLLCHLFMYLVLNIFKPFFLINNKYKNMWIIAERGDDARDNGYHLFKYIRENYPEINIKYVISNKSSDRNKVTRLGNIVNRNSIEHYISLVCAEKLISTHIMGFSPNMYIYLTLYKKKLLKFHGHIIFLQHGIINHYLEGLTYPNTEVDLFVCSALPEYREVKCNYGHPDHVVKYLGLARFDNLHEFTTKKQILIIPTWRSWLNNFDGSSDYDLINKFRDSQYYLRYMEILNDEKLIGLLEKNNYNLIFYPHYEMQKFLSEFRSTSERVKVASFSNYDIQKLLKESSLLVTDYSSVFFDFAYMRKPVLYYQFDKERFYNNHYKQGYFDYKKNGFGPVVENYLDLIDEIEQYFIYGEQYNIDKYVERVEEFFPLHDDKNRERIFLEIKNMK